MILYEILRLIRILNAGLVIEYFPTVKLTQVKDLSSSPATSYQEPLFYRLICSADLHFAFKPTSFLVPPF